MIYTAEYVGCGHPDRLSDRIVKEITEKALIYDSRALVGIECGVSTDKVFITGRIASGKNKCSINKKDVIKIVRDVYKKARYTEEYGFKPYYNKLKIYTDICFDKLSRDESDLRSYSDDQSISIGYANNIDDIDNVPIEQYIANNIGYMLNHELLYDDDEIMEYFGTDFKILVELIETNNIYKWNKLTISIMHKKDIEFDEMYSLIVDKLKEIINVIPLKSSEHKALNTIDDNLILFNGAGDFYIGGPMGDDGLSGKKLVVDFYGPRVPIGGGAFYGKDNHKVDVVGPFIAREVALGLVKKYNYKEVIVKVSFSPGEDKPNYIEAIYKDSFGIENIVPTNLIYGLDYYSIDKASARMKDIYKSIFNIDIQNNMFIDLFNIKKISF